jgi:hypothetical protein
MVQSDCQAETQASHTCCQCQTQNISPLLTDRVHLSLQSMLAYLGCHPVNHYLLTYMARENRAPTVGANRLMRHYQGCHGMTLCVVRCCPAVRHQSTQAVSVPRTARRVPHVSLVGCHYSSSTGSTGIRQEPTCTAAGGQGWCTGCSSSEGRRSTCDVCGEVGC